MGNPFDITKRSLGMVSDQVGTLYVDNGEREGFFQITTAGASAGDVLTYNPAVEGKMEWAAPTGGDGGTSAGDSAVSNVPGSGSPGAYQGYDENLTLFAGLTPAADRLPYFDAADSMALAVFTAAGRALMDDADAAAQRTTLSAARLIVRTATKNSAYTAAAYDQVVCNASTASATFAVKLPASPTVGDPIVVFLEVDDLGTALASRKTVTIDRNGNAVDGSTSTEKWRLCKAGDWVSFTWEGGTVGWFVEDHIQPISMRATLASDTTGSVAANGGVLTNVPLDGTSLDTHSCFDSSNKRFSAMRGGTYLPAGLVGIGSIDNTATMEAGAYDGTTLLLGAHNINGSGGARNVRADFSGQLITVAQGGYIVLQGAHNSAAAKEFLNTPRTSLTVTEVR